MEQLVRSKSSPLIRRRARWWNGSRRIRRIQPLKGGGPKRGKGPVRQILLPAVLLAMALFAGSYGLQQFLRQPFFAVREVRWEGIERLRPEVLSAKLEPLVGLNIFQVRLDDVMARLSGEPNIGWVAVRRELPHRIVIALRETAPAGLLRRGGETFLLDRSGKIMERLSASGRDLYLNLPRLEGKGSEDSDSLGQGLALGAFLAGHYPPGSAVAIEMGSGNDLIVTWRGVRVHWGVGDYPKKWSRLQQVMSDLEERGDSTRDVDLRFDRQVLVRLGD